MTLESLGITKEELVERAVQALLEECREECKNQIAKEVAATLKAKIEFKVNEIVEETARLTFDTGFIPVNTWGEPTGKPTTIREMFTKRCTEWWAQKVDRNGKPSDSSYNQEGTMAQYQARLVVEKFIKEELPTQLQELVTTAKNEMGKAFAVQISNTVMKQFGIKVQ